MQISKQDRACLDSQLESILLVAARPVSFSELGAVLTSPPDAVMEALRRLTASLRGGIRLQLHDGHAQLVTAPEHHELIHRFLGATRPPPLSRAALETLSIVAYRQPVTRSEIEAVRGVNSDRALQTLLLRGLVEERGRREVIGRPGEYGTTFAFLEYFGLASLKDLPPLDYPPEETVHPSVLGMRASKDRERG